MWSLDNFFKVIREVIGLGWEFIVFVLLDYCFSSYIIIVINGMIGDNVLRSEIGIEFYWCKNLKDKGVIIYVINIVCVMFLSY